jgi:hypothetical protein
MRIRTQALNGDLILRCEGKARASKDEVANKSSTF